MLLATLVNSTEELLQIHQLNQENIKYNISAVEQAREGFVSWLYPIELLQKMHDLAPSVIVKEDDKVVAYALTTLNESSEFHKDLEIFFHNLETLHFKGKPLLDYSFYCMGQICVAKNCRGKGLVNMLYQHHRQIYSDRFDFIITEISTSNIRSIKAHEKVGFESIYVYKDSVDEWSVVVWDWNDRIM